jgi:cytoskeletal protein RodZ
VNGFETLKTMDIGEIYRQTHISVAELQAILAKRFENFNRAKALGFFKILEREYNLDLSELVAEYEAFHGSKSEDNQIFVVAKEEKSRAGKYLIVVLALIAVTLGWTFAQLARNSQSAAQVTTRSASETPKSAAEEINPLAEEAKRTIAEPKPMETLAPIVIEPTIEERREESAAAQFYIVPEGDLWMQITYLDTGQSEQRTISSRYELDPTRDADFLFGHGRFTLIRGSEIIEPQTNLRQRLRLNNGSLTRVVAPTRSPTTESAQAQGETN